MAAPITDLLKGSQTQKVDVTEIGLGVVLSQRHGSPSKLYPCAFFSSKLSLAEHN